MPGRYEFHLPERPQRDGWFKMGSIDVTTTALLVGLGVLSMFVYAASTEWLSKLVFVSPFVRSGELWRVVTWPIANPPTQIFVILTLAFFWFVGHRIEVLIGRQKFTWLILAMTVLPAAVVSFLDTGVAYGLGTLGLGLLVVYAFEYPNAMFFFNIPAWVITAVYVAIAALQYLGNRDWGQLWMLVGVIAVGVIGARQCGILNELAMIPRLTGGGPRRQPAPARAGRQRKEAAVVQGPWSGPSPIDQVELDGLLDKIHAQGIDSLSKAEKQRLNDLSKRLRGS